ncbi:MAG: IS701 family transposase [Thermoguttaceae bacterium]
MSRTTKNQCTQEFYNNVNRLSSAVKSATAFYFTKIIIAAICTMSASRTVTSWILSACLSEKYRNVYYQLPVIGKLADKINDIMICIILEFIELRNLFSGRIQLIIDDTPTKRYGKHIEAGGYHHNPTPGKSDATICYGHSWVVLSIVLAHTKWGNITLPLKFSLYIRKKEIDKLIKLPKYKDLVFKKKTELAVELIGWIVEKVCKYHIPIELIVDNGYANEPVFEPVMKCGVKIVTRLRKDAVLFELPKICKTGKPGRPQLYGNKINVQELFLCNDNWKTIECDVYGKIVTKKIKSFVCTSKLTRGKRLRIVLIQEDKAQVILTSTDVQQSAQEIIESYGKRFSIEEMFKGAP